MRKITAKITDFALNEENIEGISQMFQEFLQKFQKRLLSRNKFRSLDAEQSEQILDLAEKYVMIKCHRHLFCPLTTQDEHKDRLLQNRVRKLQSISATDLNSVIDEGSQKVQELMEQAIDDLLQLDCRCTPQGKLDLINNCCTRIFEMLELSLNNEFVSSDHFLPTLIYICIKSNLPRFHSNVNFVIRFRRQQCLNMGQTAFFFTNFCSALAFIEDMSSRNDVLRSVEKQTLPTDKMSNLNNSPKYFDFEHENNSIFGENLRKLEMIRAKQEQVLRESQELRKQISYFRHYMNNEVAEILRDLPIAKTTNDGDSAFSDQPLSNNE